MDLRYAGERDVAQLLELEVASFRCDRISGRSWKALIDSRSAIVLVAARQRSIIGAAVLLFKKGSAVARLYSIAVAKNARGAGIGHALLTRAVNSARRLGCREMRLESRMDNQSAHHLFHNLGFEQFGLVHKAYYRDGTGALRFRKALVSR